MQRRLYNAALERVPRGARSVFSFAHQLRRIYNHPAMLVLEERTKRGGKRAADAEEGGGEEAEAVTLPTLKGRWWEDVWATQNLADAQLVEPGLSGKVEIVLRILKLAVAAGEKTLLFSQSLESLTALEEVLRRAPSPRDAGRLGWMRGLDYLRFDGQCSAEERDQMISHFNQPRLDLKLFLISTKAGGQGLNLAAASRVIVFDASWNPSNDTQAVFRAYRYGQEKEVVVYRLISEGFEQKIYRQQIVKLQLAGRVLDDQLHEAAFTQEELKDLWRPVHLAPQLPSGEEPRFTTPVAKMNEASWVAQLADRGATSDVGCGSWLSDVDDHNARLEGDDEVLDVIEQEDADNDLTAEMNQMPREEAICQECGTNHENIPFKRFELQCSKCTDAKTGLPTKTLLPPAAPIVKCRPGPNHLHFQIHGEDIDHCGNKTTAVPPGSEYHVQWRGFDTGVIPAEGTDQLWKDPKRPIRPSSLISKKGLCTTKQYQVRVRARLGPCTCGASNPVVEGGQVPEMSHIRCADQIGECRWTPWSEPSKPARPTAPEEEAVAPTPVEGAA